MGHKTIPERERRPAAPAASPAPQPAQSQDAARGGPQGASQLAGGLTASLQPDHPQVLVVDDEVVVRRVVTDYLERKGFSVASVESGQAALDWLKQKRPQLILLDIFMPGVNGLDVLREVRRDQPQVDVLVISGFADQELERKVRLLGAVDCLRKPFDFSALHALVATRLGQARR